MKQLLTCLLLIVLLSDNSAQIDLKNRIDVRLGYGGIDGLSGMTFLSAAYGRAIKNGFILKGSYLKGSRIEKHVSDIHGSINIYGVGLQKAVNTSGASSINLGLGYKLANVYTTVGMYPGRSGYYHGVDVELSYLHNFNDSIGFYAGVNFTTAIFMFSANMGSCIYF